MCAGGLQGRTTTSLAQPRSRRNCPQTHHREHSCVRACPSSCCPPPSLPPSPTPLWPAPPPAAPAPPCLCGVRGLLDGVDEHATHVWGHAQRRAQVVVLKVLAQHAQAAVALGRTHGAGEGEGGGGSRDARGTGRHTHAPHTQACQRSGVGESGTGVFTEGGGGRGVQATAIVARSSSSMLGVLLCTGMSRATHTAGARPSKQQQQQQTPRPT